MENNNFKNWGFNEFKDFFKYDITKFKQIPKEYIDYRIACVAVERASHLISEIEESLIDRNLIEISVKNGGKNLTIVPKEYIDEDLCIMAIMKKPKIILDIIELSLFPVTKNMLLAACKSRTSSLTYFRKEDFDLLNKEDINKITNHDISSVIYFPLKFKIKEFYDSLVLSLSNCDKKQHNRIFRTETALRDLVYKKEKPEWYNKDWLYEKVKEFPFLCSHLFSLRPKDNVQTYDLLFFAIKSIINDPYEKMENDIKIMISKSRLDKVNKEKEMSITKYLFKHLEDEYLEVIFNDMYSVDEIRMIIAIEESAKLTPMKTMKL